MRVLGLIKGLGLQGLRAWVWVDVEWGSGSGSMLDSRILRAGIPALQFGCIRNRKLKLSVFYFGVVGAVWHSSSA